MTEAALFVWAATIGPHDARTWCGKEISVADVKRAVQQMAQEARDREIAEKYPEHTGDDL